MPLEHLPDQRDTGVEVVEDTDAESDGGPSTSGQQGGSARLGPAQVRQCA
ncbi:hypothetical protein [Paractinoplanes atraurantiacus]|nr:hypothetical protein [Actinoplanes atraurantiacus]